MKRKISLAVCALALVLGFTGCSNKKTSDIDSAALQQSCESVFSVIQSGGISPEDISSMSDWNQGYLMAQFEGTTGVKMEAGALVTALEGWEAAQEECGAYVSHGDYVVETSSTGTTVTTEAQFAERDASLEFTFDENLTLDAVTVGAHYSMGEILQKAGLNTLLGMGTVFFVLVFMIFVISLIKYVPALVERKSKDEPAPAAAAAPEPAPAVVEEETEMDDTELVAVIAAAIAAAEGTSADGFVVRSIKRRKSNKWNA